MDTTCFDECFLFCVKTVKTFFFIQTYLNLEVWCNRYVAAPFETSILKKVRISYSLFPQLHYNAAVPIMLLLLTCS